MPTGFISNGGGITSVDATDMCIGPDGYLYVAYSRINNSSPARGQVRKFNPTTGALVKIFTLDAVATNVVHPIKIIATNNSVLVLDDTPPMAGQSTIYEIDPLETVTVRPITISMASDILYDGSDLWITSGSTVYKTDRSGNILNTIVPQALLNVSNVAAGLGMIWTSYLNDNLTGDTNLSKTFPGLPGEP
jgi:hypothetical protein